MIFKLRAISRFRNKWFAVQTILVDDKFSSLKARTEIFFRCHPNLLRHHQERWIKLNCEFKEIQYRANYVTLRIFNLHYYLQISLQPSIVFFLLLIIIDWHCKLILKFQWETLSNVTCVASGNSKCWSDFHATSNAMENKEERAEGLEIFWLKLLNVNIEKILDNSRQFVLKMRKG